MQIKKENGVKDAEKHTTRAGLVAGMRERTGLMAEPFQDI